MATFAMEEEEVADSTPAAEELLPCHICGRTFLPRPLQTHTKVCEKNANKKPKVFNSLKQRVLGTDLAEFHKQTTMAPNFVPPSQLQSTSSPYMTAAPTKPRQPQPQAGSQGTSEMTQSVTQAESRNTWKEKHEEFVKAIKAAKASDVPKETLQTSVRRSISAAGSMGVTERCPSCDRRFGVKAYDRHVEWCKERRREQCHQRSPAAVLVAKERLEARTKYRVPPLAKSKRSITREKYSPGHHLESRTESMASVRSMASGRSSISVDRTGNQNRQQARLAPMVAPPPAISPRVISPIPSPTDNVSDHYEEWKTSDNEISSKEVTPRQSNSSGWKTNRIYLKYLEKKNMLKKEPTSTVYSSRISPEKEQYNKESLDFNVKKIEYIKRPVQRRWNSACINSKPIESLDKFNEKECSRLENETKENRRRNEKNRQKSGRWKTIKEVTNKRESEKWKTDNETVKRKVPKLNLIRNDNFNQEEEVEEWTSHHRDNFEVESLNHLENNTKMSPNKKEQSTSFSNEPDTYISVDKVWDIAEEEFLTSARTKTDDYTSTPQKLSLSAHEKELINEQLKSQKTDQIDVSVYFADINDKVTCSCTESPLEKLISNCTVSENCQLFIDTKPKDDRCASATRKVNAEECELEIEVYASRSLVADVKKMRTSCDGKSTTGTTEIIFEGKQCLDILNQLVKPSAKRLKSINIAFGAVTTPEKETSFLPDINQSKSSNKNKTHETYTKDNFYEEYKDDLGVSFIHSPQKLDKNCQNDSFRSTPNNSFRKSNSFEENKEKLQLPLIKGATTPEKNRIWEKKSLNDTLNTSRTMIELVDKYEPPKLKRGSTFVKTLSPIITNSPHDIVTETPRSKSESDQSQYSKNVEDRLSSPDGTYDPLATAEKQLLELLHCDDKKDIEKVKPRTLTRTRSLNTRSSAPPATAPARVSLGGILGIPKKPNDNSPPTDNLYTDDFEMIENYINDNFGNNCDKKLKSTDYKNSNIKDYLALNDRKYSDELSIDPKLINENDNLTIPENLLIEGYSPPEDHYSVQYDSKIEEPRSVTKHLSGTIDDIDFEEFMSTFDDDEFILPIRCSSGPSKKLFDKTTVSLNSSAGFSPSPPHPVIKNSPENKKPLGPIKRSVSLSNPVVKARSLRTKQDIQDYLHPIKIDKEKSVGDELFPPDHDMYDEYKRYEEEYLREKAQKIDSERKRGKNENGSYVDLGGSPSHPAAIPGNKFSGDSAYGSLNRNTSKTSSMRISRTSAKARIDSGLTKKPTKTSPAPRDPSPSSSESERSHQPKRTSTTNAIKNDHLRMSKFCHECGSKFPVSTAKFCVECGIKRLIL